MAGGETSPIASELPADVRESSEPPARDSAVVPAFFPLTVANALSHALHTSLFPLLPSLLPGRSFSSYALMYASFALPTLIVHPVAASPRTVPVRTVLLVAFLAQTIGAILLTFVTLCEAGISTHIFLLIALLLGGSGASAAQSATVRLVCSSRSGDTQAIGAHLTLLEAAAAAGATIGPLGAALLSNGGKASYVPIGLAAASHVLVLVVVFESLRGHKDPAIDGSSQGPRSALHAWFMRDSAEADFAAPIAAAYRSLEIPAAFSTQADRDIRESLSKPRVWSVLTCMFCAVASLAFLRPILELYVERRGSHMIVGAALFALIALIGAGTEVVTSSYLVSLLGVRPVIIGGIAVAALGFALQRVQVSLGIGVAIMAVGASGALVLTIGELSAAMEIETMSLSDSVGTVATVTFCLGEMFGPIASGALRDATGSFKKTVGYWAAFLAVIALFASLQGVSENARAWIRGYQGAGIDEEEESDPLLG